MKPKKWGIVGGGIMGMTLAHRLAKQGHEVTIFEAAPELGGLVSSWKMGDVEWDKFYHVILLSDFGTRDILKEIGLGRNQNRVLHEWKVVFNVRYNRIFKISNS
jgi:protoporphyrinogen oxidase